MSKASHTPSSMPVGSVKDVVESWLLANSRQLASVEQAVQTLAAFVPGQMREAEATSEAIAAALSIVSLWKDDAAARKVPAKLAELESGVLANPELALSSHGRHIAALYKYSRAYKLGAQALEIAKATELLLEMLARSRGGQRGRWKMVVTVEALKAFLRLGLLGISHRPLAIPPVHASEFDVAEVEKLFAASSAGKTQQGSPSLPDLQNIAHDGDAQQIALNRATAGVNDVQWKMPRTGRLLSSTPIDVKALLHTRVLVPEQARQPLDLIRRGNKQIFAGEVMAILRPWIYAVLCAQMAKKKSGRGGKWLPWVVGVLVETVAKRLSQQGLSKLPGGELQVSAVERELSSAKTRSLFWWLLREPVFTTTVRPAIEAIANKVQRIPLVGISGVLIKDYLYLLDAYYFATASL